MEFYIWTFSRSVKLDQVKKSRLEYSEWLIPIYIPLEKLRIIVVYRRPYLEKHKVFIGIFVNEFSDLPDSIILSKEQLFVFGDFNIHVDVSNDPDALKIIIIIMSLLGPY